MKIERIGILTCNNPQQLSRCLDSYLRHLAANGRQAEITVMDDSLDPAVQGLNQEAILKRAGQARFRYAGPNEKRAFLSALHDRSGVDPAILRFLIGDYPYSGYRDGGNRNAMMLEMAGEAFLSSDDDIVCRIHTPEENAEHPETSTSPDPGEVSLFRSEEELLHQYPETGGDLLSVHERFLGAPTPSGTVRLTVSGFYGDPGVRFPTFYLWSGPRMREQLILDPNRYTSLLVSRQIHKAPAVTCLSKGAHLQTTGPAAFDAREALIPFMPVMRGSDLLFSQTLKSCRTDCWMAYLSIALHHAPLRPRVNQLEGMMEASAQFTLPSLMRVVIEGYQAAEESAPDLKQRELAAHLVRWGSARPEEYESYLRAGLTKLAQNRIAGLQKQLELNQHSPDYWARDIEAFIQAVHRQLSKPRWHWPSDVVGEGDPIGTAQEITRKFGELLGAWPAIFDAARDLKFQGVRLSREMH